jgi:hypothetical protein
MNGEDFDKLIDLIAAMAFHRTRPLTQTVIDKEQKMIEDLRTRLVKE